MNSTLRHQFYDRSLLRIVFFLLLGALLLGAAIRHPAPIPRGQSELRTPNARDAASEASSATAIEQRGAGSGLTDAGNIGMY